MNGVITDARTFHKARPQQIAAPIPVKYVSEEPRKRLLNLYFWVESTQEEIHSFFLYTPWVHYEWAFVPHLSPHSPWLMNGIYFSPTPLCESLYVSNPCLPNFYDAIPCCSENTELTQEHWQDPTFIHNFWNELFNLDGDLFSHGHPTWFHLKTLSGADSYDGREDINKIFKTWESLSLHDVLSLPWPQNLLIPEDGRKL